MVRWMYVEGQEKRASENAKANSWPQITAAHTVTWIGTQSTCRCVIPTSFVLGLGCCSISVYCPTLCATCILFASEITAYSAGASFFTMNMIERIVQCRVEAQNMISVEETPGEGCQYALEAANPCIFLTC